MSTLISRHPFMLVLERAEALLCSESEHSLYVVHHTPPPFGRLLSKIGALNNNNSSKMMILPRVPIKSQVLGAQIL